jgi:hypothetical protein
VHDDTEATAEITESSTGFYKYLSPLTAESSEGVIKLSVQQLLSYSQLIQTLFAHLYLAAQSRADTHI